MSGSGRGGPGRGGSARSGSVRGGSGQSGSGAGSSGRGGSGAPWRRPPTAAERRALARDPATPAGLCRDCRHLRLLGSGRSRFVRCFLAESDPAYPRYPALPVLACDGHEPWRSTS